MESELSPDKENNIPPLPLKTYQWEDLRRSREAGGYPWTHIYKTPLQGEITAEDIIRSTTPKRSMSREFTRSRTHSPDNDMQKILNLDSSPGSSRRHNEDGGDEGIHIPNFSKEVSLDSEDDVLHQTKTAVPTDTQTNTYLASPVEIPKNVSPKSILKRRTPEQQFIGVSETREKTKCCHPLVNKIKHLADRTLHKMERNENEKSPVSKRKKNEEVQEIRQLRNSPSAVRRQKFSVIKLGSSDEMSKTMSVDTPPPRKRKEHIYEDIEEAKDTVVEETLLTEKHNDEDNKNNSNKENDLLEKKSIASYDPSLLLDDNVSLKPDDHIMEKLHSKDNTNREAILLDDEFDDTDEPNVDEIFQNQVHDARPSNDSPNITITEIMDSDASNNNIESSTTVPIETSPSPSPRDHERKRNEVEFFDREWSKPNSDHEYEIIEKPTPNIIYTSPSVDEPASVTKADDDVSSTTSLERKYLQHTSDEEEQIDDKVNFIDEKSENILNAEALQKDIEDRFFVNTPSTVSRTECEVSTSQVDSSALENLPLKRENRNKTTENSDKNIQQRIKEGTGKLKSQAGKLKTKIQNIKTKQFSLPEKSKFKMPERPKFSLPDRSKFTLSSKRKFSLPDRPKFKKINISEKLSLGDRKKFTVPELPKFKMPERPKINFPSLGRKKNTISESSSDLQNVATVEFETKTYPRLFNRKKKPQILKISSSPTLNREDTPPPTFTFTRVKDSGKNSKYIPDSPKQPREYGAVDQENNYETESEERKFETTYDFDKIDTKYLDKINNQLHLKDTESAISTPDMSPSVHEFTHINEINNDEFFVRPRGISRENIQVREYLSDEIRQAFNIPKNVLAVMGSDTNMNNEHVHTDELEADPDLMADDGEELKYSTEDINERDDGYYTFPPVRPSRAKRKKKELETIQYIDGSTNVSMQFSEVDLGLSEDHFDELHVHETQNTDINKTINENDFRPSTDLRSIHEYANDDVIEYPDAIPIQSQTLPMPPKRRKKFPKTDIKHTSLNDFNNYTPTEKWDEPQKQIEEIIVYRTEHEYTVPHAKSDHSPVPPRRNRSRSSRTTSFCDDDRTSHGAESLILDTNLPLTNDVEDREIRHESPGYATVDKGSCVSSKLRRSTSKTPPVRRRKSNSSERKYYTVSGNKSALPNRPPRKKSSASMTTLDSFTKRSLSGDYTQYVEIEEPPFEEVHRDLKSGQVLSKMKDRPLPPPPRPPRGPKQKKRDVNDEKGHEKTSYELQQSEAFSYCNEDDNKTPDVVEIEVSTQTDPLPDDMDYEMDENLDLSISSSLRDIIDEESILGKNLTKTPTHASRSFSRSEKSLKLSDPKISELSKSNIGRTSPTVILVEKRVSSPTRINERDEMLTEASLTVQHIDIDESQIPDVPPLPKSRGKPVAQTVSSTKPTPSQGTTRPMITDGNREAQFDNLVTQRLQVRDLDVGRLNVSELQASKIHVSEIEGITLNVNELESKAGNISVSGIEFSPSVIDEIVKKFAEISTNVGSLPQIQTSVEIIRPISREEETQTEPSTIEAKPPEIKDIELPPTPSQSSVGPVEDSIPPPQRPPPPDLTPLLFSYLHDLTNIPTMLNQQRQARERPLSELFDSQQQAPPPPTRRAKRKPAVPRTESSSEEDKPRPSPRRLAPATRTHEPTITEAGAQFLRVCQNSITRTLRNIFNTFMSYINRAEDKKDIQMAMVIFLVLIAGLIMFGLSDSRTIHHHHWEFFNPPDNNK